MSELMNTMWIEQYAKSAVAAARSVYLLGSVS